MKIDKSQTQAIVTMSIGSLVVAAGLAAAGCSSAEPNRDPETSTSSAITTVYEAESMGFSGTGEVRSTPAPAHRFFWGNGYIYQNQDFGGGVVTITVRAQGVLAAGVGPHIVVSVGGVVIGDTHVNETTWTNKTFTATVAAGTQELRITYDNDLYEPPQDRGLLVDWVSVDGCQPATYEAEQMFHSTGGATTGGWNLWSSGYLSTNHGFAAGQATVTVIARGSVAAGVWPHMRVSIGGTEVGSTYVTTAGWSSYPFNVTATAAIQEIRITYDNDFQSASEDRNLMVDKVVMGCAVDPAPGDGSGGTPYPSGVAFRGINRAGMEYGDDWDGWTGQTYYELPSHSQIASELAYFKAKGMNVIRLPIAWERVQRQLYGALTQAYVDRMMDYINSATAAGFAVILDLHGYNRYATNTHDAQGQQAGSYTQHTLYDGFLTVDHLRDVWVKLTNAVLGNPKVILNLMNESHDFNRTSNGWFADINTLIAAIRGTGSTHLILVPNSRSSDVDHWSTYAPNGGDLDSVAALAVTDSANNYAYDMHAYQSVPTSCTSYRDLIANVTSWATTNHKKLFLSELGVNASAGNGACAINSLLSYMNAHGDVWIGWTPWDLPPYNITSGHTADGTEMPWYAPFLTANFLP